MMSQENDKDNPIDEKADGGNKPKDDPLVWKFIVDKIRENVSLLW